MNRFFNVWIAIQTLNFCAGLAQWSNEAFFRRDEGNYLANSVIQKSYGLSEMGCVMFCSREDGCMSVNHKMAGENKGMCELNNRTMENSPENGREMPDFVHLVMIRLEQESAVTTAVTPFTTDIPLTTDFPFTTDIPSTMDIQQPQVQPTIPVLEGLYTSLILGEKVDYVNQLLTWLNNESNWTVCYRASQHGWSSTGFHSRCDNKAPTVTIVGIGNYTFGGYSNISWGGNGGFKQCPGCFIFSLRNKDNLGPFKSHPYKQKEEAINCLGSTGPQFGFDVVIKLNDGQSSFSQFGNTYLPPSGYSYSTDTATTFLAGIEFFRPDEVEVFYLNGYT